MRVMLDGPLGDRVIYSGVPEAYHRVTGHKLRLGSYTEQGVVFHAVFDHNPYAVIDDTRPVLVGRGDVVPRLHFECVTDDVVNEYRPRLLLFDLTGRWQDRDSVNPNLYVPRRPVARRCVVSDEAGWESRRGYPHLDALVRALNADGWETVLMRNLGMSPPQVQSASHRACFTSLWDAIHFLATAELYVGYDSGLANVAGALGVPYLLLCGATPSCTVRHRSCVWAYDCCPIPCVSFACRRCCLVQAPDVTGEAMAAVRGALG